MFRSKIAKSTALRFRSLKGFERVNNVLYRKSYVTDCGKDDYHTKLHLNSRNPNLFSYIMQYYRDGRIAIRNPADKEAIANELAFFCIPSTVLQENPLEKTKADVPPERMQEKVTVLIDNHIFETKRLNFLKNDGSLLGKYFGHKISSVPSWNELLESQVEKEPAKMKPMAQPDLYSIAKQSMQEKLRLFQSVLDKEIENAVYGGFYGVNLDLALTKNMEWEESPQYFRRSQVSGYSNTVLISLEELRFFCNLFENRKQVMIDDNVITGSILKSYQNGLLAGINPVLSVQWLNRENKQFHETNKRVQKRVELFAQEILPHVQSEVEKGVLAPKFYIPPKFIHRTLGNADSLEKRISLYCAKYLLLDINGEKNIRLEKEKTREYVHYDLSAKVNMDWNTFWTSTYINDAYASRYRSELLCQELSKAIGQQVKVNTFSMKMQEKLEPVETALSYKMDNGFQKSCRIAMFEVILQQ